MVALVRCGLHGGRKAWFLFLVALHLCSFARGEDARESAVVVAREGRTEEAIASLRELRQAKPDDPLVAYDLAVVLTWAHQPREATNVFEGAPPAEVPEYVLPAMIRAYRGQKRFAEAERWAQEARARFPFDSAYQKLLGLVLADQDRVEEAIAILQPLTTAEPGDAEAWLALGYASQRARDRFGTLRSYGRALRLEPENREAANAMAGVMSELGGPFGAARLLAEPPLALRASQAGLLARWGERIAPRDPRQRFEGTDLALDRIDQLLREAQSYRRPDRGVILRLRRDRV